MGRRPKRGNSVRRQSPNARLEVSNAALDGGASLWQMVRHAHHPEPVEGGIGLHKINFEIFPLPIGERVRVRGI